MYNADDRYFSGVNSKHTNGTPEGALGMPASMLILGLSLITADCVLAHSSDFLSEHVAKPTSWEVAELHGFLPQAKGRGAFEFSPDGNYFGLPLSSGAVQLWHLPDSKLATFDSAFPAGTYAIPTISFSHDSKWICVVQEGEVRIIDLASSETLLRVEPEVDHTLLAASFKQRSEAVVTVCRELRTDPEDPPLLKHLSLLTWDIKKRALISTTRRDDVLRLSGLSPSGRIALLRLVNLPETTLVDLETGRVLQKVGLPEGAVFSDDGSYLATVEAGTVRVWSMQSRAVVHTFLVARSDYGRVYPAGEHLALSRDGAVVALGQYRNSNEVGLFDARNGNLCASIAVGPPGHVCSEIRFASSGRLLATGTSSYSVDEVPVAPTIRFWEIKRRE
jgi:WD40 repeat protein